MLLFVVSGDVDQRQLCLFRLDEFLLEKRDDFLFSDVASHVIFFGY